MSPAAQDFDAKAKIGLQALAGFTELGRDVERGVDGFFTRHPELARTRLAEAFIAGLLLDQLSTAADSQSAAQPTAETQKVA